MAAATTVVGVLVFLLARALLVTAAAKPDYSNEKDSAYWRTLADDDLQRTVKNSQTLGRAKNVILFLGDGMGPTTVTAGRILAGQMKGFSGEDYRLSFDKLPHTGLAVTYSVDTQVTDSAASATAYTSGVKTNQGMLGLNAKATRGDCKSVKGSEVETILRWFKNDGRAAGVVTTTTITHATPASTYSHSADRDWEVDRWMTPKALEAGCKDIALQLVEDNSDIEVLMGGGLNHFKPVGYVHPHPDTDSYYAAKIKRRNDSRDLIEEWEKKKKDDKARYKFVSDRSQFDKVDPTTDYLFGLFAEYHMAYEIDRNSTWEPSLAEMTEKAIKILQKNEKGFFLMVEGGRIDHGHHQSKASKALHDVVSFSDAVAKGLELTDESDTLILVTADHSHTMTIAGYASRGNPILGKSDGGEALTLDKMPYTTILYADGPGYKVSSENNVNANSTSTRENVTNVDTTHKEYQSQSAVPMIMETHGGEDVAMYARGRVDKYVVMIMVKPGRMVLSSRGPQSYLYAGVHENVYIPMLMAYASCVGPYKDKNKCAAETVINASPAVHMPPVAVLLLVALSVVSYIHRS